MKQVLCLASLLLGALVLSSGCGVSVNKSLSLADGQTQDSGMTTVNGRIRIGNDAELGGNARTVNGGITVGDRSKVESLETVNGSVKVGSETTVNGDLKTVNGSVTCAYGAEVAGEIATVNGSIKLTHATVAEDLTTVNGSVELRDASTVHGDIRFKGSGGKRSKPRELILTDGSVLKGNVVVDKDNPQLIIELKGDSKIEGQIPDGVEISSDTPTPPTPETI